MTNFKTTSTPFTPLQALNDSLKKHKSSLGQLKELNSLYELEQKLREEQHEISIKAEKRANDLNLEVEDVKIQMEQVSGSIIAGIFQLGCF